MADSKVTIDCPICSTGSTATSTKTDADSTTSTTNDTPAGTNVPATTNSKVEHAIGKSIAIATASSTSMQHTYDLTGYKIPIQVEGIVAVRGSGPVGVESEVGIERLTNGEAEGGALGASTNIITPPKRPALAFNIEGIGPSGARKNQNEGTQNDTSEPAKTLIFNCPIKQQSFQATLVRDENDGPIRVLDVEAISPDKSLLLDVGKQIASDSLKASPSFCTSMIGTSTGAIAVYTALFAVAIPKSCTFNIGYGLLAILPAIVFIVAAVCFAFGAFPIDGSFWPSDPYSIETYRENILSLRMSRLRFGFAFFCIGMALAVIVVVLVTATHIGCTS